MQTVQCIGLLIFRGMTAAIMESYTDSGVRIARVLKMIELIALRNCGAA